MVTKENPLYRETLLTTDWVSIAETGIKLENVGGLTTWEASPSYKHQRVSFRIQSSIHPQPDQSVQESGCECIHAADTYIRFPDGSLKRPDIAIFCREPDEEDEPVTLLPEAVIEIISKGYEKKDLDVGVPFYIAQGIKDVIVFDPRTNQVTHHHNSQTDTHTSPVILTLQCSCVCTV